MKVFGKTIFCLFVFLLAISDVWAEEESSRVVLSSDLQPVSFRFRQTSENENPKPAFALNWKDIKEFCLSGLESAAKLKSFPPSLSPVATGLYWAVFAEDAMLESLDLEADEAKHRLYLMGETADKLEELRRQGADFKKDERVQEILTSLKTEIRNPESAYSFVGKALVHMPYVTARKLGVRWLAAFFGDRLSRKLKLGEKVNLIWTGKWAGGKPRLRAKLSRTVWRHLKQQGERAQLWTDFLIKEAVKAAFRKIARENAQQVIDERYAEIMRENPSTVRTIPPDYLQMRTLIAVDPVMALPLLPAALPEPVPVTLPEEIRMYRDPVVNAAAVENQIISTETKAENIRSGSMQGYSGPPCRRIPIRETTLKGSWDGIPGQGLYDR